MLLTPLKKKDTKNVLLEDNLIRFHMQCNLFDLSETSTDNSYNINNTEMRLRDKAKITSVRYAIKDNVTGKHALLQINVYSSIDAYLQPAVVDSSVIKNVVYSTEHYSTMLARRYDITSACAYIEDDKESEEVLNRLKTVAYPRGLSTICRLHMETFLSLKTSVVRSVADMKFEDATLNEMFTITPLAYSIETESNIMQPYHPLTILKENKIMDAKFLLHQQLLRKLIEKLHEHAYTAINPDDKVTMTLKWDKENKFINLDITSIESISSTTNNGGSIVLSVKNYEDYDEHHRDLYLMSDCKYKHTGEMTRSVMEYYGTEYMQIISHFNVINISWSTDGSDNLTEGNVYWADCTEVVRYLGDDENFFAEFETGAIEIYNLKIAQWESYREQIMATKKPSDVILPFSSL